MPPRPSRPLALPVAFEANHGQTDPAVRFVSRRKDHDLFLTAREAVFALHPATTGKAVALRLRWIGARATPAIAAAALSDGRSHYFIGHDLRRWILNVPQYREVHYRGLYSGIDMLFRGGAQGLEYDFVLAPFARPGQIRLQVIGGRPRIDDLGNVRIATANGEVVQRRPLAFQTIAGVRRTVPVSYVVDEDVVRFAVGSYDPAEPLTIDPEVLYSTYLGGSASDRGDGVAADGSGHAFVAGSTLSLDFPTENAFQPAYGGGHRDCFVTKLNSQGTGLVYSTYLGGAAADSCVISVDTGGRANLTGVTESLDFPVTPGAFQPVFGGGPEDAFVTRLSSDGASLVFSTYLGGNFNDVGYAITNDHEDKVYVTGGTGSSDFPVTPGAFQPVLKSPPDAFVAKFEHDGSALVYSTYLGGSANEAGFGIAVDAHANAYIVGQTPSPDYPTTPGSFQPVFAGFFDAFVSKLGRDGSTLVYSTFLGGSGNDQCEDVAVERDGEAAYCAGWTESPDFPTTPGAFQPAYQGVRDAVVAKLNAAGSALAYSTLLGGTLLDFAYDVGVDQAGHAYVTGGTISPDFPVTGNATQPANAGGSDAFVTKLDKTGSAAEFSTYLGGTLDDEGLALALESVGSFFVSGRTFSLDFPTTPGAYQSANRGVEDAFVVEFGRGTRQVPASLALQPAVSTHVGGTTVCLAATVLDEGGSGIRDVLVRFQVAGATSLRVAESTNASGQASLCYVGPSFPGQDVITAYADGDEDGAADPGEPDDTSAITWTP